MEQEENNSAPSQSKDNYILQLLTLPGFIDRFYEMQTHYQSHERAYEAVERLYTKHFGGRKYKDFESFRICMDKFIRKDKAIND